MDNMQIQNFYQGNNYFKAKIIEIDKLILQNQQLRQNIEQVIPLLQDSLQKIEEKVEILQKDLYSKKSLQNHNYNFIFCNIKNPLLTFFLNQYKTYAKLNMEFIDDDGQSDNFSNLNFEDFSQISESDESSINFNYDIKTTLQDDDEKITLEKKKFNFYADIFNKNCKNNLPKKKKKKKQNLVAQIQKDNYNIKFYDKKRQYVNILEQKQQIKQEEKLKRKQIEQFLKLNWDEIYNQELLKKFRQTQNLKDIDYIELSDYLFKKQKQNLFKTKIPGVEIYKFIKKQIKYQTQNEWTKEKEQKLIQLYEVTNEQNVTQVALYFEEFSNRDCIKKYSRLLCPSIKWQPDQDFKLIFGVIAFKASWSRICSIIFQNQKNQMQCRERFANVLNPQIVYQKLDRISIIEVVYLNQFGQTWAQIEKYRFPNTTDNQLLRMAKKFEDNKPKLFNFICDTVNEQIKLGRNSNFDRDRKQIEQYIDQQKNINSNDYKEAKDIIDQNNKKEKKVNKQFQKLMNQI